MKKVSQSDFTLFNTLKKNNSYFISIMFLKLHKKKTSPKAGIMTFAQHTYHDVWVCLLTSLLEREAQYSFFSYIATNLSIFAPRLNYVQKDYNLGNNTHTHTQAHTQVCRKHNEGSTIINWVYLCSGLVILTRGLYLEAQRRFRSSTARGMQKHSR